MDTTTIVTIVTTILGAIGGFEFVKWLFTRRYGKRKEEAEADGSEFAVLKETTIFLQEQLRLKEERFAEQTQMVRNLTAKELELTRRIATLEAERGLKRCEVRKCNDREPQSGY